MIFNYQHPVLLTDIFCYNSPLSVWLSVAHRSLSQGVHSAAGIFTAAQHPSIMAVTRAEAMDEKKVFKMERLNQFPFQGQTDSLLQCGEVPQSHQTGVIRDLLQRKDLLAPRG